ncbi:type II secretion system F family protein [Propionibacteriaceae bacterium Y1700]|uniref:type II secretion system F family protein n=1 Tax=Microlunatus sp. Y1700 TaxID=3418487 RepID=UPI003DA6D3D8
MTAGAQAWLVLAVLAAGLAARLAVPPRRMPHQARPPLALPERWMRLLLGRSDGISARRRGLLAIPVLLGTTIGLQGLGVPGPAAWVMAALAAAVGWVLLGRIEPDAVRRRREQLVDDLPHTCELLGSCLSVGLPLRTAVEAVARAVDGPVAEDLARVNALIDVGADEATAWRSLSDHPQWGRLAGDLARSCEYGATLTGALTRHAEEARTQRRAAREARARTAGVKSVIPLMVCFLPAFFLIGVVPIIAGLVLHLLG